MNKYCIPILFLSRMPGPVITPPSYDQSPAPVHLYISETCDIAEFRTPSMITTLSGSILAVCDARVDRPGDFPNNIDQVIRRSLDKGETWEESRTILDFANQEGGADPSLVQDATTGRIFLIYTYCQGRNHITDGPNRNRRHLSLQYIYSDDHGKTWPDKRRIYSGPSAYSRLTVLPDGGIGLFYENGQESPYEKISFVKFPVDWIINNK